MVQESKWLWLVEAYIAERSALRQIGPRSIPMERSTLSRFVAGANELDRAHVVRWAAANRHLAPGTMRERHGKVRAFVAWAHGRGVLDADPMAGIPSPRVPRSVPRALGAHELAALWRTLPDSRSRAIVALMAGMGMRLNEVACLQVGDWDRYAQVIHLRHGVKNGSERVLPVPSHVATILDTYLREHPARAGALVRSQHDHRSSISCGRIGILMSEWMTAAGIKAGAWDGRACHSLRHTFAQVLYVEGGEKDLRVVQSALGHAHLASTEIYMRRHIDVELLRAAMGNAAAAQDRYVTDLR